VDRITSLDITLIASFNERNENMNFKKYVSALAGFLIPVTVFTADLSRNIDKTGYLPELNTVHAKDELGTRAQDDFRAWCVQNVFSESPQTTYDLCGQHIVTTDQGHLNYDNGTGKMYITDFAGNHEVVQDFEQNGKFGSFILSRYKDNKFLVVSYLPEGYKMERLSKKDLRGLCSADLYSLEDNYKKPVAHFAAGSEHVLPDVFEIFMANDFLVLCSEHSKYTRDTPSFSLQEYAKIDGATLESLQTSVFFDGRLKEIVSVGNQLFFIKSNGLIRVMTVGGMLQDYNVQWADGKDQLSDSQRLNEVHSVNNQYLMFCVENQSSTEESNSSLHVYDIKNNTMHSNSIDLADILAVERFYCYAKWTHCHNNKFFISEESHKKGAYGVVTEVNPRYLHVIDLVNAKHENKICIGTADEVTSCSAYKNLLLVLKVVNVGVAGSGVSIWDLNMLQQIRHVACPTFLESSVVMTDSSVCLVTPVDGEDNTEVTNILLGDMSVKELWNNYPLPILLHMIHSYRESSDKV
jgi:hypothetical protein